MVQCLEHPDVGGVAAAQIVARDDDQPGVGGVTQSFGERSFGGGGHRTKRYPVHRAHRPRFAASAARAAATNSVEWATLGAMVSGWA